MERRHGEEHRGPLGRDGVQQALRVQALGDEQRGAPTRAGDVLPRPKAKCDLDAEKSHRRGRYLDADAHEVGGGHESA
jgi:hypothetical protein